MFRKYWETVILFFPFSFHAGGWQVWCLIASGKECVRAEDRSIPQDFCCSENLNWLRIGLWEKSEWLGRLWKEREGLLSKKN